MGRNHTADTHIEPLLLHHGGQIRQQAITRMFIDTPGKEGFEQETPQDNVDSQQKNEHGKNYVSGDHAYSRIFLSLNLTARMS